MNSYAHISGMPNQLVSITEKMGNGDTVTQWGRQCMDFFDSVGAFQTEEKRKDFLNYQLFNGQYTPDDYEYVTDPMMYDSVPEDIARFRHYPICSPPIKELWGEMKNRPFNFICKSESERNMNEYVQAKTEMLWEYVQNEVMTNLQQRGK